MANFNDRAAHASATVGFGAVTIGAALGAVVPNLCGWQSFANSGVIDQQLISYLILDTNGNWEYGWGVYTLSSTSFTRNVTRSSTGTTAINLSGNEQVFLTARAEDLATLDALSSQNMAINGAMDVSQENGTSVLTLTSSGALKYVVDGMLAFYKSAGATVQSFQSSVPAGTTGLNLQNSLTLKATVGNGGVIAADDYACLAHPVEGYRFAKALFGQSNAQSITIGFWAFATVGGTFALSIRNSALNRAYVTDLVIGAATWQWFSVVIPPDLAGAWTTTNGVGTYLTWAVVPTVNQTGVVNTWTAANIITTAATTNFLSAANNLFAITGLVVLPGAHQISQEQSSNLQRSLDEALRLCQRYYEKSYTLGTLPGAVADPGATYTFLGGLPAAVYEVDWTVYFKVSKRATPTITIYSPATGASGKIRDRTAAVDVAGLSFFAGENSVALDATVNAAQAGYNMEAHWIADARL